MADLLYCTRCGERVELLPGLSIACPKCNGLLGHKPLSQSAPRPESPAFPAHRRVLWTDASYADGFAGMAVVGVGALVGVLDTFSRHVRSSHEAECLAVARAIEMVKGDWGHGHPVEIRTDAVMPATPAGRLYHLRHVRRHGNRAHSPARRARLGGR